MDTREPLAPAGLEAQGGVSVVLLARSSTVQGVEVARLKRTGRSRDEGSLKSFLERNASSFSHSVVRSQLRRAPATWTLYRSACFSVDVSGFPPTPATRGTVYPPVSCPSRLTVGNQTLFGHDRRGRRRPRCPGRSLSRS